MSIWVDFFTYRTLSTRSSDLRRQLESTVSRDIDVLRRPFFHQSKAESEGFRLEKEWVSEDINISRYGRFELVSLIARSRRERSIGENKSGMANFDGDFHGWKTFKSWNLVILIDIWMEFHRIVTILNQIHRFDPSKCKFMIPNSNRPYLEILMSSDAHSFTNRKPWLSAFDW